MKLVFLRQRGLLRGLMLGVLIPCTLTVASPMPSFAESSSDRVQQGVVSAGFDRVPSELYQSDRPLALTQDQRKRLEEALQHSHLPGPALPRTSGMVPLPTGPETEIQSSSRAGLTSLQAGLSAPSSQASPLAASLIQSTEVFSATAAIGSTTEPSVAQSGNRTFYTGNWFAAQSTNGGQSWTFLDPFTGPFSPPASDPPGFCCDQVTIYDPSSNAIFWLQQYVKSTAQNTGTQRINVDMGADGTWDCKYDFTPANFGLGAGKWFDFPDLALTAAFLYHTTNVFNVSNDQFANSAVARYPLSQIGQCQTINVQFFTSATESGPRLTHGATTTMYWATHNSTSSMRVRSWADSSSTNSSVDRTVTTWPQNLPYSCPGPDLKNMCGRTDGRIVGAYVTNGVVGFMWTASQGGTFTFPHVRVAKFNQTNLTLLAEQQIFSSSFAWAYPSVSPNGQGDVGGTILSGGGALHLGCHAWASSGSNGGSFQPLDQVEIIRSTSGPINDRAGDYLTSRRHPTDPKAWVGTCYSLQGGGTDGNARPLYVQFTNAPPVLGVTPTSLDFGTIEVGQFKDLNLTVQNTGGGTLTGTATTTAPFNIVSGGSFSVAPSATQSVVVRFSPTGAGAASGTVAFTSNGGNTSPAVSGTGTNPPPPPSGDGGCTIAPAGSADALFPALLMISLALLGWRRSRKSL